MNRYIFIFLICGFYFPMSKILPYPLHYFIAPIITIPEIYRLKNYKKYLFLYKYEIIYLFFSLFAISRSIFSKYFFSSFTLSLNFFICILCYLSFYNSLKSLNIKKVEKIIQKISIFFIISSFFLFFTDFGKIIDRGLPRLIGTFFDPNLYCLACIFPIGYYLSDHKTINKKIIFYGAIVLFFMTLSRGGIIGLFFLFFGSNLSNKKKLLKYFFMMCLFLILLYFLKDNIISDGLYRRIKDLSILNSQNKESLGSGRIGLWLSGITILKENFLFGVGINNFPHYLYDLGKGFHYLHNTFLEVIVETGIVGGSLYFLFLGKFILMKNKNEKARVLKNIIYSQLIMCFFLTALLSIQIFFTFVLYKYYNTK